MPLDIQPTDLVQVRFETRAGLTYRDTRKVLRLEDQAVIVAGGEHGMGRKVARSAVLCVIPVANVCDVCHDRPCKCERDDEGF